MYLDGETTLYTIHLKHLLRYAASSALQSTRLQSSTSYTTARLPPTAEKQSIFEAYREARRAAEKRLAAPPKRISFNRKKFAPYLEKLGNDQALEKLFLEFLRERVG